MKATYQQPTTDIMVLETIKMIAASNGALLGTTEPGVIDLNSAEDTDATNGNLARRRSVWDDEDEEE